MTDAPPEVRALAAERADARAARDFARADALRDRIADLGYRVVDRPDGPGLEPLAPEPSTEPGPTRLRPADVASVLDEPATADVSLHWVVEGWPEDVARAVTGFRTHQGARRVQYVVADLTETDPAVYGEGVEVLRLEPGAGWGAARNAGLKRSLGGIVLALDGSVEPVGDAFGPLEAALEHPGVGVCGPYGITTTDLREFHESDGVGAARRVDAIEGYLMAFRRDVLRDAGLFDEHFRWYRSADIELCFRLKEAGRDAVVVDVPVERHQHRMWHATPAEERERLSKRNFYRFLDRFRDRFDLLVSPRAE